MWRWAVVLLFVFLSGCSASTRAVVRLDTGQGEPLVHTPRRDVEPAAVSEKEFKKAVAQHAPAVPAVERPLEYAGRLFGVPERSGWYRYEGRSQRLMASEPESTRDLRLLPEDEELKRSYLLWCERTWGGGDCLRLLVDCYRAGWLLEVRAGWLLDSDLAENPRQFKALRPPLAVPFGQP